MSEAKATLRFPQLSTVCKWKVHKVSDLAGIRLRENSKLFLPTLCMTQFEKRSASVALIDSPGSREVDSSRKDGHPQYQQMANESFHFPGTRAIDEGNAS